MTNTYDVIILGAGPNGLECGAYLAKAGLKVLLLEKRIEVGGGMDEGEVTLPGFLHNLHAIYMMMTEYAPPYQDFQLEEKYNIKHVYPPLQFAMPLSDGRCLCLYSDLDKTCESIAQFSKKDADSYREIYHKYQEYVQYYVAPATYYPTSPLLDLVAKMQQTDIGRELFELTERSPQEVVDELFENETVRALMLYVIGLWGLEYDVTGVGYLIPLYLNRSTNYRLVVGGTHMVASAFNRIIMENGGLTMTSRRVKRIIVEDNTAKGVEMDDGTVFEATKAVVSTLDTHQTFLHLIGEDKLSEDFSESINSWMWETESLFVVHLALDSPPNLSVASANPELNQANIYVIGFESIDDLIKHYEAIRNGELLPGSGFHCSFPSVHDPKQAPPGRCTGLITELAPYNLKDGGADQWYKFKFQEAHADDLINTLTKYAPDLREKLLWKNWSSPRGMEDRFSDMVQGSFKQGEYHPLQMGYNRPHSQCSNHRSPLKNLYMGGSCTYPGGTVIWGAGYLAANAVAEDAGIQKWWSEPEIVTEAIKKGLL
jgi:phytoene dehydrogenase-like protein